MAKSKKVPGGTPVEINGRTGMAFTDEKKAKDYLLSKFIGKKKDRK